MGRFQIWFDDKGHWRFTHSSFCYQTQTLGHAIFMHILWYFRDIKVIPTFLGFIKPSGGVKYDPIISFLLFLKASGADGVTPAWFPISSQRIGGEPANLQKTWNQSITILSESSKRL